MELKIWKGSRLIAKFKMDAPWPLLKDIEKDLNIPQDRTDRRLLTFDFSKVDYLTGATLGQLIDLHRTLKKAEWQPVFKNLNTHVAEILEVTGLTMVFNIHSRPYAELCR